MLAAGLALALGIAAAPDAMAASADPTLGTQANVATPSVTSAYGLIDSVGVNVHMSYNDTSYADAGRVVTLLQGLGVRHVRDGLVSGRADQVAALQALGVAGIRSELILSGAGSLLGGMHVDDAQIAELRQVASTTDAVEPTNEADCSGDSSWASHLHTYAQQLATTLQGDDATRALGVLGPAFCRPDSVQQYGAVGSAASATNAHEYAGGQLPELGSEGRLPQWGAIQGAGRPQVVTETGYSDIANSAYPYQASPAEIADETLRTLLDNKRLGVARSYLYELLDEKPDAGQSDPEQHFGLVADDGTPKPAYTAVQNLLRDVARATTSTGVAAVGPATASTAPYPVTLTGGGSLVRSLVTTDPGGKGETVALWLAAPVTTPATPVRVSVGSRVTATAQRPSRGNTTTTLGTGTSFDVPTDGAVTLVHLGAAPASTRAATAACTTGLDYAHQAAALGASVIDPLTAAGWQGGATAPASLPRWLPPGGAEITTSSQQVHVAVPNGPTAWTVGVWARTDSGSGTAAPFLHATGVTGALLRTYDLTGDVPSHVQLSAYGPASGSAPGEEMYGHVVPDSWHFLALAVGPTSTTLYVDGIAAGTVSSSAQPLTGLDLGALDGAFRGSLAGLSVFPTALSPAAVAALATAADRPCAASSTSAAVAPTAVAPTSATQKTSESSGARKASAKKHKKKHKAKHRHKKHRRTKH